MKSNKTISIIMVVSMIVAVVWTGVAIHQHIVIERLRTNYRNVALEYQLGYERQDKRAVQRWKAEAARQAKLTQRESRRVIVLENTLNLTVQDRLDCAVRYSEMEKNPHSSIVPGYGGSDGRSYFIVWHTGRYLPRHWGDGRGAGSRAPRDARDIVCATAKQARRWVGVP